MMHPLNPRLTLLLAVLITEPSVAAVNDVFPADFVPLPEGMTGTAFYWYKRDQSGPYRDRKQTIPGSLDTNIAALRLTHTFELGGIKLAPLAILSWSRLNFEPSALRNALAPQGTGYGDLRLGTTAWLVDDVQAGHYLGLNAILTVPTGTYHSSQPVNVGENRYRLTLGGGWMHPIAMRDLLLEISPEVTFYGDNDKYLGNQQLAQDTGYALTGYLRYRLSMPWQVHVGWQGNRGGQTRVNDINQNNAANNQRVMTGATWNIDPGNQVILRWAKDYRIDNGFKLEREMALRWLHMW